ncbi:hypothetical protein [Candidatus Cetobacterium colombiensis]|uniref:Uncharacterized protein n=1 Tax=Candidatus Cetobacterium colombiensis TaxID=3073100 RepID=A0ABU4W6Q4_9FUSO|nr:hypothetical protein [Candidatus Cetobacterium colombiensis]MDX8335208.1 hypothetical protein [Candidatus Cetobacterium colombiensis]
MKKLITLFFTIFNLISYSFHIMPDGFEKRIDNGQGYQEFYFPNNGLETLRYKFSASPGSDIRGDMSQWVEFYPKVLTVKPGETGLLKVFAKAPKQAKEGEYGFHLDSSLISIPNMKKDGSGIKSNVGIKINTSLEMIGYVGNLEPEIKIEKYRVYEENGKTKLDISIKNPSDKRGVEFGIQVKGKKNSLVRNTLGRIYEGV